MTYNQELELYMQKTIILKTTKYMGHSIHKIDRTSIFANGTKVNHYVITGPHQNCFPYWLNLLFLNDAKNLIKEYLACKS